MVCSTRFPPWSLFSRYGRSESARGVGRVVAVDAVPTKQPGTTLVLIAHSSVGTSSVIQTALDRLSLRFDYLSVGDGAAAVQSAYRDHPAIAILDVALPHLSGYQVCRLLRHTPATQAMGIILLGADNHPMDRYWSQSTGGDAFVSRSSLLDELGPAVLSLLQRRQTPRLSLTSGVPSVLPDGQAVLEQVNHVLDQQLYTAAIRSEIANTAAKMRDLQETVTTVMEWIARLVDYDMGCLVIGGQEPEVMVRINRPFPTILREQVQSDVTSEFRRLGGLFAHHQVVTTVSVAESAAHSGTVFADILTDSIDADRVQTITLPLHAAGQLCGLLALSGVDLTLREEERTQLTTIADQAFIVIDNARLYQQVRQMAVTDELTGLANRRAVNITLRQEAMRAVRHSLSYALLMIDLDHFKRINDSYGHDVGDRALQHLATLVTTLLRGTDTVGRYGGEEFIVLLPQTDLDAALLVAERIRAKIERSPLRLDHQHIAMTTSIGVAASPRGELSLDDALKQVDSALYRAKEEGRNRVYPAVFNAQPPPA